ncbi:MAG: DedA family protein [Desulfuromonas sp.]|nr:DedA family protein [Desulfuromonas sp.]
METWLQDLLTNLTNGVSYYALVALIACGEGLVLVGLIIPGSVLCVTVGVLAANGHGDFLFSCLSAGIGAICGDLLSYLIGGRAGHQLVNHVLSPRSLKLLRRAELFFAAHGGKSLLLARFFGPLRGFMPFIAGCIQMSPREVLLYSVSGGLLWGLSYPALGYYGGLSWQRLQLSPYSVIGLISLIMALILALWWWRRKQP